MGNHVVFGKNLKKFLEKKQMSTQEFAETVGFSELKLAKIIKGEVLINKKDRQAVADALQVPLESME